MFCFHFYSSYIEIAINSFIKFKPGQQFSGEQPFYPLLLNSEYSLDPPLLIRSFTDAGAEMAAVASKRKFQTLVQGNFRMGIAGCQLLEISMENKP